MATVRPGHHPATTTVLLFLLLACPIDSAATPDPGLPFASATEDDIFQVLLKWIIDYQRVYSSLLEQQHRFNIFRDNLLYILGINEQEGLTYKLGLNNFTDVTQDEFQEHYLGLNHEPALLRSAPAATRFVYADVEAKDAVDWRNEGAVTEVKNQVSCGE